MTQISMQSAAKATTLFLGVRKGRFIIIDDRKYKYVEKFELDKPIHGIQFNPANNHFAIGREYL